MKLMAVMAHPDDAEIWSGGTLALHAERGDAVRICTLSYSEDSTRGREAQEGAKRMGCDVECLGLKDTLIRDSDEAVQQLMKSMDSFLPDAIITHWFDDMHPDHEATFRVLRRTLLQHFLVNAIDDFKAFPRIFCCDTYNSLGLHGPFKPDIFVDVTHVWGKKERAIKAHQSQILSLYLDMTERQCLIHGKAAGSKRAEGFLHLPLFGRPDDGEPLGG